MSKATFESLTATNVVARGREILTTVGWVRGLLPAAPGLKLGIGSTFSSGPTAAVRYLLPRFAAGAAAAETAREWINADDSKR
jgi:hypothetical protein